MIAYPLKMTAHVRKYYFGERLIPEVLGKRDVPEGVVAETWEISDYQDTTGTITNGEYAGRTLHDLVEEFPEDLVARGWSGPHFPLLGKFLDASHLLPVHLHADDETARRKHAEPHGKSEAWHILWCAEGSTVLAGVKGGVSREELFEAFKEQDYEAVMPRHEIKAGDTVYVPGGVIHTFGPDTLIFEIQQTSDLGRSVMPHDLYGNALDEATWDENINEALDELKTDFLPRPNPGLSLAGRESLRRTLCCAGPHFAMERWSFGESCAEPERDGRFVMLSNVGESEVSIEYEGGSETLERAESCILPAAMERSRLSPSGEASLVACYVPDLLRDVVEPLRNEGYPDIEIRALGEVVA